MSPEGDTPSPPARPLPPYERGSAAPEPHCAEPAPRRHLGPRARSEPCVSARGARRGPGSAMQRAAGGGAPGGSGGGSGGPGTAFSIDSLIGPPPPRSGHLLYTGYPMFMPYRPLVLPQALAPAPLPAGLPPLAPLASFAGRLSNTFCAGLGQAVPSMVALTTALPSFAEPPDAYYGPPELAAAAAAASTASRSNPEPAARRTEGALDADELLPAREKVAEPPPPPPPHFSETFSSLPGKCWGRRGFDRQEFPDRDQSRTPATCLEPDPSSRAMFIPQHLQIPKPCSGLGAPEASPAARFFGIVVHKPRPVSFFQDPFVFLFSRMGFLRASAGPYGDSIWGQLSL